jgi:hypothetical protein
MLLRAFGVIYLSKGSTAIYTPAICKTFVKLL